MGNPGIDLLLMNSQTMKICQCAHVQVWSVFRRSEKDYGILFSHIQDNLMNRWIEAASAVMWSLYQTVVVKKELTENMRLQVPMVRMSFICKVAGHSLRDNVEGWDTQEELRVEPLLIHVERSQLMWLRHLFFRCLPDASCGRYSEHVPLRRGPREDPGNTGESIPLCVLGTPRDSPSRASRSVHGQRILGVRDSVTSPQIKQLKKNGSLYAGTANE